MSTCRDYPCKCMLGYFCLSRRNEMKQDLSRRRVATATEAGSIFVDFVDSN